MSKENGLNILGVISVATAVALSPESVAASPILKPQPINDMSESGMPSQGKGQICWVGYTGETQCKQNDGSCKSGKMPKGGEQITCWYMNAQPDPTPKSKRVVVDPATRVYADGSPVKPSKLSNWLRRLSESFK